MPNIDRTNFYTYATPNRAGPTDFGAEHIHDGNKVLQNATDAAKGIGAMLIDGNDCAEANSHGGASTTTICNLTAPDGHLDIGDILFIGEGGSNLRVWRVAVTYDREISFSDTHLISGASGTANYNAIQTNLLIWTAAKAKVHTVIGKTEIARGSFAQALHLDDLQRAQTDATNANTALAGVETDLLVTHNADGSQKAESIKNAALDADETLNTEGFLNLLKNANFENWSGGASAPPDYWVEEASTVQVSKEITLQKYGTACGKMTNPPAGLGIRQTLDNYPDFASVPVTDSIWLKGSVSMTARIEVQSGTTTYVDCAVTTSWQRFMLTQTPGASPTTMLVRLYCPSAVTGILYFDGAIFTPGRIVKGYERDTQPFQPLNNPENLLVNSSFEIWGGNVGDAPDGWTKVGSCVLSKETTNGIRHGSASCKIATSGAADEGIKEIISVLPKLRRMRNRKVTFSIYGQTPSPSLGISIILDNGVSSTIKSFTAPPTANDQFRAFVSATIDAAATSISVEVKVDTAGGGYTLYLDCAALTFGDQPYEWGLGPEDLAYEANVHSACFFLLHTNTSPQFGALTPQGRPIVVIGAEIQCAATLTGAMTICITTPYTTLYLDVASGDHHGVASYTTKGRVDVGVELSISCGPPATSDTYATVVVFYKMIPSNV